MRDQRKGDWIQTATGGVFWPLDPRADEVDIEDIAHALSNMCRYTGHCRKFYSVAQHSVLVSDAVPRKDALWGLLHDAAEAYVVDVPRPLKPFLLEYGAIEDRVMSVICDRFGMRHEMPDSVKVADRAVLADEKRDIMAPCIRDWGLTEPELGVPVIPVGPTQAKAMFLDSFNRLRAQA